MKKLMFLIVVILFTGLTVNAQDYSGRTKHKPVTTLKKSQVKKIMKGKNLYVRKNGKVKRNL